MFDEGVDSELVKRNKSKKVNKERNMFQMSDKFKAAIQGLDGTPSSIMSKPELRRGSRAKREP
jgi:hypothetical protein